MKIKEKLNNTTLGLILGILLPLIIFFIFYKMKYSDLSFPVFLKSLHELRLLLQLLSLCVLPNLGLFYLFINNNMLKAGRGVVIACFLFAFIVLGYRLTV